MKDRDRAYLIDITEAARLAVGTFKAATKWAASIIESIEEIGAADLRLKIREGIEVDWQEKGLELIIALARHKQRIIFILDELPVPVQNIERKHGPSLVSSSTGSAVFAELSGWSKVSRQYACHAWASLGFINR